MHVPSDLLQQGAAVGIFAYVVSLLKNAIDKDERTWNLIKIIGALAIAFVVLAIALWLLSGGLARLPPHERQAIEVPDVAVRRIATMVVRVAAQRPSSDHWLLWRASAVRPSTSTSTAPSPSTSTATATSTSAAPSLSTSPATPVLLATWLSLAYFSRTAGARRSPKRA